MRTTPDSSHRRATIPSSPCSEVCAHPNFFTGNLSLALAKTMTHPDSHCQRHTSALTGLLALIFLVLPFNGCQTPDPERRASGAAPVESVTMAERRLADIHTQQTRLMESYRSNPENYDTESMEMRVIRIIRQYESYLHSNPNDLTARILYGKFLVEVGQHESAIRQFLEVDRRDPGIPVVKQQIGNYLAEEGRYMAALPYFINATDLDPKEGLYPYQLGLLLHRYAAHFVEDGFYTQETLEKEMQSAFREACRRDPDNFAFHLRYGESFLDVRNPDWQVALRNWDRTLPLATSDLDRQVVLLHRARALHELKRDREALAIAEEVSHHQLAYSRDRLLERIRGQ